MDVEVCHKALLPSLSLSLRTRLPVSTLDTVHEGDSAGESLQQVRREEEGLSFEQRALGSEWKKLRQGLPGYS